MNLLINAKYTQNILLCSEMPNICSVSSSICRGYPCTLYSIVVVLCTDESVFIGTDNRMYGIVVQAHRTKHCDVWIVITRDSEVILLSSGVFVYLFVCYDVCRDDFTKNDLCNRAWKQIYCIIYGSCDIFLAYSIFGLGFGMKDR